ncbi:outer membrane protein assembly factor BamB family protein [Rhodococcus indonesiensis]
MRAALRTVMLTTSAALVLTGCGSSSGPVDVFAAGAWPGRYADARNSSTAQADGLRDVAPAWSRPLGGAVTSPASVAANGQIFVTGATTVGCNLVSFQIDTGRKRWCTRLAPGVAGVTPAVDGVANIYVGEEGAMVSFNEHGQRRWRIPVSGTPGTAQFTGDGNLVFVTHFGQVNVLDPQTGKHAAPIFDLVPTPAVTDGTNVPRLPNDHGLAACFGGSEDCPVATTPAVDLDTGRILVTLWRPGADRAAVVSMRYTGGDDARVVEEWSQTELPGGATTSPVLSADGATVYVHDGEGALWALDAGSGAPRWSHDLGYVASAGPAVSAEGLLVLAPGGRTGDLVALRDTGEAAETVWRRGDVRQLGVPALTADGTGYTVARADDGLAALVFDAASGETLDEETLPGAAGFSVGTAVGPAGEFVTTTLPGEVYVLR